MEIYIMPSCLASIASRLASTYHVHLTNRQSLRSITAMKRQTGSEGALTRLFSWFYDTNHDTGTSHDNILSLKIPHWPLLKHE